MNIQMNIAEKAVNKIGGVQAGLIVNFPSYISDMTGFCESETC